MAKKQKRNPPVARSAIFGYIEEQQILHNGGRFGRVLDAGTGLHSLRWIATLLDDNSNDDDGVSISSFIGITADDAMKRRVEREAKRLRIPNLMTTTTATTLAVEEPSDGNKFIIGNWFVNKDNTASSSADVESILLATEPRNQNKFNVVLADYLIGAMDAFSPYQQDEMVGKLSRFLKPSGRLYLVGMEPIPDYHRPDDGDVFCKATRIRDAVIKMAHNQSNTQQRPYREYPMEWVRRQIRNDPLLEEIDSTKLHLKYKHNNIVNQINVARGKLGYIDHDPTAEAVKLLLNELEKESKTVTDNAKHNMVSVNGFDYIVVAQRKSAFEEYQMRLARDHPGTLLALLLALVCLCGFLLVRLSLAGNSSENKTKKIVAIETKKSNKKKL